MAVAPATSIRMEPRLAQMNQEINVISMRTGHGPAQVNPKTNAILMQTELGPAGKIAFLVLTACGPATKFYLVLGASE